MSLGRGWRRSAERRSGIAEAAQVGPTAGRKGAEKERTGQNTAALREAQTPEKEGGLPYAHTGAHSREQW